MHSDGPIAPESKISRKPRVAYRDLEEGGVLLDLESGDYHGLNSTGAAVWKLLEGERSFGDVVQEFEAMLDDPPGGLREQVTLFLDGLRQAGLISVREA
jgi:hypothetical protein